MVNRILILNLVLMAFHTTAIMANTVVENPNTTLKTFLSSQRVTLGDPVSLTLSTTSKEYLLKEIDYATLKSLFYIDTIEHNTALENDEVQQIMSFRLFARNVGLISLPVLELGSLKTPPVKLEVIPSPDIFVELTPQADTIRVMQQQQWVVQMKLRSVSPYLTLQLGENKDTAIEALAIITDKKGVQTPQGKLTEQTVVWSLATFRLGNYEVELPPVHVIQGGKLQKIFYFPRYSLQVKPLPSYIPPSIAIGSVALSQHFEQHWFVSAGNIYYWHIELSGTGIQPLTIPSITNRLLTTRRIQYYPAEVSRAYRLQDGVVVGSIRYKIPFEPLTLGPLSLPKLEINAYNPSDHRLVNQTVPGATFIALNTPIKLCFLLATLLFIHFFGLAQVRRMTNYFRHRHQWKQALLLLNVAANATEIRTALKRYAQAHAWEENVSLHSWLENFMTTYGQTALLFQHYERLQYELYSGQSLGGDELIALKSNLHTALRACGFKQVKVKYAIGKPNRSNESVGENAPP